MAYRAAMRDHLSRALLAILASGALAGCSQAPPEKPEPARRSFAEDGDWVPAGDQGTPVAADDTDRRAAEIRQGWEQVRSGDDPAEQQRRAEELQQQTRELAEPAGN